MMRMHADEVDTTPDQVRRLLAAQFPRWADRPFSRVASSGTDHAIYRIGPDLCARMPRIGWATAQAAKERKWLPRLAPGGAAHLVVQRNLGADSLHRWLAGQGFQVERGVNLR